MTLRARLALGLIAIAVVLLLPLAITLGALQRVGREAQALSAGDFQASIVLGRLREALADVRTSETNLLILGDSASQAGVLRAVGRMQALSDSLAGFELDTSAARLRAAVGEIAVAIPREVEEVRAGRPRVADTIALAVTDSALRRAERGIGIAESSLKERSRDRVLAVTAATARAVRSAAVALVAAVIVAAALALWLLNSISRPVRELERGMGAIADGEFTHRLGIDRRRRDEFGRLSTGYHEMARRLQELDKLKAEFISVASHELKTPVNVMVGYLQLLQEGIYGELTPKQREILGTIEAQGQTLARLIRHLLDISRFEAGGSRVEPRPMALGRFLEELEQAFHVLAVQREVRFLLSKGDGLPDEVVWDHDRMNEVVGNLLTNAFKFTPRGGTVELRATPHEGDAIMISVRDTGAGIPAEQLPRIFQKFYQADNQRAAAQQGTGLGLAIAKEIVQAHRGAIACDSTEGTGTTFTIVLPRVVRRRSSAHIATPAEVA